MAAGRRRAVLAALLFLIGATEWEGLRPSRRQSAATAAAVGLSSSALAAGAVGVEEPSATAPASPASRGPGSGASSAVTSSEVAAAIAAALDAEEAAAAQALGGSSESTGSEWSDALDELEARPLSRAFAPAGKVHASARDASALELLLRSNRLGSLLLLLMGAAVLGGLTQYHISRREAEGASAGSDLHSLSQASRLAREHLADSLSSLSRLQRAMLQDRDVVHSQLEAARRVAVSLSNAETVDRPDLAQLRRVRSQLAAEGQAAPSSSSEGSDSESKGRAQLLWNGLSWARSLVFRSAASDKPLDALFRALELLLVGAGDDESLQAFEDARAAAAAFLRTFPRERHVLLSEHAEVQTAIKGFSAKVQEARSALEGARAAFNGRVAQVRTEIAALRSEDPARQNQAKKLENLVDAAENYRTRLLRPGDGLMASMATTLATAVRELEDLALRQRSVGESLEAAKGSLLKADRLVARIESSFGGAGEAADLSAH